MVFSSYKGVRSKSLNHEILTYMAMCANVLPKVEWFQIYPVTFAHSESKCGFFTLSKSIKVFTCQKFPISNLTNAFRTGSSA